MGLFITEDGQHYRGWLAAFFCCCAALDVDEHPGEWSKPRSSIHENRHVVHQQPMSSQPPPPPYTLPLDPISGKCLPNGNQDAFHHACAPPRAFDQGSRPLLGQQQSNARRSSRQLSTSIPSASHRTDRSRSPRHSLVPLKLAPVTLRRLSADDDTSPLETTRKHSRHQRSESTQELLQDSASHTAPSDSYRQSRDSPYRRLQRQSLDALSRQQAHLDDQLSYPAQHHCPPLSAQSSSTSLRRSIAEDGSSSVTSRSSNELPLRIKRKHSGALSTRGDDADNAADRDILELNTIHEEHKPDCPRPTTTKSEGHVPAVAPSMQVHARSETLTDIGSILSRPLGLKDVKAFDQLLEELDDRDPRSTTDASKPRSRSGTRVSGWLSSIRTSSATSLVPEPSRNVVPSRPRAQSHISQASTDSRSLVSASSPVSKTRSRSMTAESRLTSPPSTVNDTFAEARSRTSTIARTEQQCQDEGWPALIHPHSQVGLAL